MHDHIAIVGGGIAGLTAAVELLRRNFQITLFVAGEALVTDAQTGTVVPHSTVDAGLQTNSRNNCADVGTGRAF